MVVVVIRKTQYASHGIARLVLSLLILIYCIFVGSSSIAKERPQMSQGEES